MNLKELSDKELLEYKKRLEYDVSKYRNNQEARKRQLNSVYGSLGNPYFRYYALSMAEAITMSGQLVIKWLEKNINNKINKLLKTNDDYVIACDTDSLVMSLEKLVEKTRESVDKEPIDILDDICEKLLQPVINLACDEIKEYLNGPVQSLAMKREILSDRVIWLAKKRYIMNVIDKEGVRYKTPELKLVGLEAVRSSTPELCRRMIKDSIKVIINGTEEEFQAKLVELKEEFMKAPISDVAFPRTVNGLKTYTSNTDIYVKQTPVHVKASLLYNAKLKEMELLSKYETIKEGEKIKFIYLKEPNYIQDTVIAFVDTLPPEFKLESQIDYDKQFNASLLKPILKILDVMHWKPKKEKTLEKFFVEIE